MSKTEYTDLEVSEGKRLCQKLINTIEDFTREHEGRKQLTCQECNVAVLHAVMNLTGSIITHVGSAAEGILGVSAMVKDALDQYVKKYIETNFDISPSDLEQCHHNHKQDDLCSASAL